MKKSRTPKTTPAQQPENLPDQPEGGTTAVNLNEIVRAMSDMLDQVGLDDFYHGKRVACMSIEFMRLLDAAGPEKFLLATTLDASLLHDCGVSSTEIHKKIISELDWEQSHVHCERGHALLAKNRLLSHLAPIVLDHHTHWEKLRDKELPQPTKILANCIYLADRIDSLITGHAPHELLLKSTEIRKTITRYREKLFAPELVDTFLSISENETFWLTLHTPYIDYYLEELKIPDRPQQLDFAALKDVAALFADIIDAKSPFTAEHSLGVARLAGYIGRLSGLDEETCELLELAGYLHDIGKLKVPDEILEKNGPLNSEERAVIIQHSFDTYQILRRISGFETIARLAAFHHETLSGEGYPFRMHDAELGIEARIIAVADVFQALAQNRPYRKAQSPEAIIDMLRAFVSSGKLDPQIVALVGRNLHSCWRTATGADAATS